MVLPDKVRKMLPRIAQSSAPLLLSGETGTGKSSLAELIHQAGPRSAAPFIEVSCAALPESLIESELFGFLRGAFTGAEKNREGRLSAARGGTILLDEVESIPLPSQAKLLRFLQKGSFERLGSNSSIQSDARVIAATNQNIRRSIESGRMREDFYQRLSVIRLELTPLRARLGHLDPLIHALSQSAAIDLGVQPIVFTSDALERLKGYSFPGNIRELEHIIYACSTISPTPAVDLATLEACGHLEERQETSEEAEPSSETTLLDLPLSQIERRAILRAIQVTRGDTAEAARRLGVSRRKLQYRLKEYRREPPQDER